jgi:hypothetical protein
VEPTAAAPDRCEGRAGEVPRRGGDDAAPHLLTRLSAAQRVVQDPSALAAEIDGEVVALNVDKGVCYGLDPVGSRIWSMLERPTAIVEICAAMAQAYDVEDAVCARDVTDLIADLASEGLVRLAPAAPDD